MHGSGGGAIGNETCVAGAMQRAGPSRGHHLIRPCQTCTVSREVLAVSCACMRWDLSLGQL